MKIAVTISNLTVPASQNATDLSARIEKEIADRRFGPGNDPLVTALATRIMDAVDAGN